MQRNEYLADSSSSPLPATLHRGDTPPWLRKNPIDLTKAMQAHALPNRANPGEPLLLDADTEWQAFSASLNPNLDDQFIVTSPSEALNAAGKEAIERAKTRQRVGSLQSEAALFALSCSPNIFQSQPLALSRYLLAQYGVLKALSILVEAEQIHVMETQDPNGKMVRNSSTEQIINRFIQFSGAVNETLNIYFSSFLEAELLFRTALAQASEEERQKAALQLKSAASLLHPSRRVLLALLLPEYPDLANQMALELPSNCPTLCWLATVVTTPEARQTVIDNSRYNDGYGDWWSFKHQFASTVIQQHGTQAPELLSYFVNNDGVADMLARIGTPDAITLLARQADGGKAKLQRFAKACERWPLAAIAAVANLLAKTGKQDKERYVTTLTALLKNNPTALEEVWSWLEPDAHQAISDLQTTAANMALPASISEMASSSGTQVSISALPPLLASPPWLQKKKTAIAPLQLEVLPLEPVEHWEEGSRDKILHWRQAKLEEARQHPEMLSEYLLNPYHSGPTISREQKYNVFFAAAQQAILDNDAAGLSDAYLNFKSAKNGGFTRPSSIFLLLLPETMALAVWPTFAADDYAYDSFFMANVGLKGLDGVLAAVEHRSESGIALAHYFGWSALAPAIAHAFIKLKTVRTSARNWLLKFPEHTITGLLPAALGRTGSARDMAVTVLRLLDTQGHTELIQQVASRYEQQEVSLAVQAMLDADPLDCYPTKISKAPAFWQPQSGPRPLLLDGTPLPDSALEHLGTMLRFPTTEGVYPGIEQVKTACQRESLANFAWHIFQQWESAGAPSKDNWAFIALGLLGTDETVRQLVPLIRTWPTEGLLARAQTGLDILVRIGSNYALLQLNGIAQKVKSKPLQLKAQEKMQELADNAGLTADELAERITPDLGLDAAGGLTLDFGPRQFRISFNELLKPVVYESDNKRLADLPKPNGSDHEYRASEAQRQFKALKRDVKALADQTLKRLERAMCQQRCWTREIFESVLVQHPLLRHVVRRLVWTYHEGEHVQIFRVAEDLSYTDAQDNPLKLPAEAEIVLAHPLNLPAHLLNEMSQLFADYELLQPFAQLSRETFLPNDADVALAEALLTAVPTNALRGLESRGWEKGDNEGGNIYAYHRQLSADCHAQLHFDPPYSLAVADKTLRHQLGPLQLKQHNESHAITQLNPLQLSELLRDLHYLQQ